MGSLNTFYVKKFETSGKETESGRVKQGANWNFIGLSANVFA